METLFDVFFNGHVIGLLLGLPLLASPARGSDGALVKRSSGVEPSRVLDLFAGIGIGGSPFGPFESREVVSVELDLAPATSLAKTTKCTLRTPGLTADPIDAGGQVLHADVRDPTWYFLSLRRPRSLMSCGLPLVNSQPWFVAGNTMGLACPDGLLIPHVLG